MVDEGLSPLTEVEFFLDNNQKRLKKEPEEFKSWTYLEEHSSKLALLMTWVRFRHRPSHELKRVNHRAVRAPVVDLEEPEGATKWGFVSGCMAGLRHRHDSLPKSKESQIRALEKAVTNTAVRLQA